MWICAILMKLNPCSDGLLLENSSIAHENGATWINKNINDWVWPRLKRPSESYWLSDGLRPLQNLHLWHISSLCTARKLAYLSDMPALSVLL
ncbi:hypothetical protein CRG49_003960 [Neisseria sp. N95_16]|nr:hypothetical protein CRG49_003960 [Neisseria sp. N95_16]